MLVSDIVRRNARHYGEWDAVVVPDGLTRSWRDLDARTDQFANALLELGLAKGDRLAIYAPNCGEYVDFFFACAKSGVVGAPLNVRLSASEIGQYLQYVEPTAILMHADLLAQAQPWLSEVRSAKYVIGFGGDHRLELDLETLIAGASPAPTSANIHDGDMYQLGATSGTTGVPKAAVLTHRNAIAAMLNWAAELDLREGGTALQNIPYFFNPGGPAGLHPVLLKGGRTVVPTAFRPGEFPELVQTYRVTNTIIVPTMVQMVIAEPACEQFDMSSLRGVMSGGSPFSAAVLKRARELMGDVMYPIYGMAESYSCGTILRPENLFTEGTEEQVRRLTSIGRPESLMNVRLVDSFGNDVPADGRTPGEIWLCGDSMSAGYFRMEEETALSRHGEWFKTGDVAVIDGDGFITIVDRLKDMIITGGINVFSIEVERRLLAHPDVDMAAVIGVPHPRWGEAIHAVILLKPGRAASEEEILQFAADGLAAFKRPRSIEFVDQLPISATGKVLKTELRKQSLARADS